MSTVSSLASSGLNFTGLASGIDTSKLVEGLLATQQARVKTLEARQGNLATLQGTFKALEAQLIDVRGTASRLGRSVAGAFDGRKVASSDDTIVKAAASASAATGTYAFKVNNLAQSHQIASAGLADLNESLQTGTLTLQVGAGAASTITIDSTNNTLQGVANAINTSGAGVTASVINDGSSTPNRLLLVSQKTGQANDIRITNNLSGAGTALDLDPTTHTIQAAADAQIVLGSGRGALTISSATNKVNNLVPGVSVDLLSADPTKTVTLTVSNDTDSAKKAVQEFVDSYNRAIDFIDERNNYDKQSGKAGTLLSSRDAAELQNELAAVLTSSVPGLSGGANRLSVAGVSINEKGRLTIDSGKLDRALRGELTGVSAADVRRIFALTGTTTNPGVEFVVGGNKTKVSSPIEVDITAAAQRGSITGTALDPSIVIGSSNKELSLTISGKSATITLGEQTYTATTLAAEIQAKINNNSAFSGATVNVSASGGSLKLTTDAFGASASVKIDGGSSLADLKLTAGQIGTGTDVVGKFIVNGTDEPATGSGQFLLGASGSANTDGLQVKSTLTSASAGVDATLTLTRGITSSLDQVLNKYLDPVNGRFKSLNDGFDRRTTDLKDVIKRQNSTMELKREALIRRFAAMEASVSKLKSLGEQVGAQLAGLQR